MFEDSYRKGENNGYFLLPGVYIRLHQAPSSFSDNGSDLLRFYVRNERWESVYAMKRRRVPEGEKERVTMSRVFVRSLLGERERLREC